MKTNKTFQILADSAKLAFPKSYKIVLWLLKLILPISLLVGILQYVGLIDYLAHFVSPVFEQIGLPGESAIVFLSSLFLTLYGPVAIVSTLAMDMRETTIIAIMCLISHNMIVECAIQKSTGSSAFKMFAVRIFCSFLAAYVLNLILPQSMGSIEKVSKVFHEQDFTSFLVDWFISSLKLVVKIFVIVYSLMFLQNILKEFKVLQFLSNLLAPFMKVFGLSKNSSFLFFVAQIIGLTYGSAIMKDEISSGQINQEDANLLNYHISVNHSLLEDTLLFVAIGVPVLWITIPRIILGFGVVWSVRLLNLIKLKYFDSLK